MMSKPFFIYETDKLTRDLYAHAERRMGTADLQNAKAIFDSSRRPPCLKSNEDEVRYILAIARFIWNGHDRNQIPSSMPNTDYGYPREFWIGGKAYEWTGEVKYSKGRYDKLWIPSHPKANPEGYAPAHIVIAEEKIGRHLRSKEVVHHVDYNPKNNAPENLEVMTHVQHMKRHRREAEVRIYEKCAVCERRTRVPLAEHVKDTLRKRTEWFCSKRCAAERKHQTGVFNPATKEMSTLTCANCGRSFEREAKRIRYKQKQGQTQFYCSPSCSGAMKTRAHHSDSKPVTPTTPE